MPEVKQDNNPNPNPNPNPTPNEPEYRDWREQRRELRRERREHDPFRGLFWGLLLILAGVLFLANQQGWITGDRWWQYLLIGLGIIFIINGLVRYGTHDLRYSSYGQFIPGIILLLVGLAFVFNFSEWWPIVLIGVGLVILLSLVFRRRG